MKERPILMLAPMVRAILDGRKTQTRRVVKPQPHYRDVAGAFASWVFKDGLLYPNAKPEVIAMCPHGRPGDRLWVRETWAHGIHALNAKHDEDGPFVYAATDGTQGRLSDKWKPSIFMPRWASRITLELTGVRVERLQEISESDAKAEGCEPAIAGQDADGPIKTYRTGYVYLWNAINEDRGFGWLTNPWVWVLEFKRV